MGDIKIELKQSEYFNRRASLLKSQEIPKLSETRATLGDWLAQIVFEHCDEALQEKFGLKPPLIGAGNDLWVSPSDLLIGKVCLKPPLTSKHVQALTHQGILDLGVKIEQKFWREMELEKTNALIEQKARQMDEFQITLKHALKDFELQERAGCEKKIETLTEEFENTLVGELFKLEMKLRDEAQQQHEETKSALEKEYEERMLSQMKKSVVDVKGECVTGANSQEEQVKREFLTKLHKIEFYKDYEIQRERASFKEMIKQLKQQLECKNIANMMYVLCMERRKCANEKANLQAEFQKERRHLKATSAKQKEEIRKLLVEQEEKNNKLMMRDRCIVEVLRQFQKFINFSLKAAPTQAEFLLSLEKMMLFELADAVQKSDYKHIRTPDVLTPWPCSPVSTESSVQDMEIKDFHKCLDEISSESDSRKTRDFLPGFYYKKNLYVREDFRNMVSQGITMRPSNQLWNRDLEKLVKTLKTSVTNITKLPDRENYRVSKTSVRFTPSFENAMKQRSKDAQIQTGLRKPLLKNSLVEHTSSINFSSVGNVEKNPYILASANSLELIRKKIVKDSEERENDSIKSDEEVFRIIKSADDMESKMEEITMDKARLSTIDKEFLEHIVANYHDVPETLEIASPKKPPKPSFNKVSPKLIQAKNSLVNIVKQEMKKTSLAVDNTPRESLQQRKRGLSKLLMVKDSLECIRDSRMKVDDKNPLTIRKSREHVSYECKGICKKIISEASPSAKEPYPIEKKVESMVSFKSEPTVLPSFVKLDSLDKIYLPRQSTKRGRKKKSKRVRKQTQVQVIGDTQAKEHMQTVEEFTVERIHSFVHMISTDRSLLKLFSACTR